MCVCLFWPNSAHVVPEELLSTRMVDSCLLVSVLNNTYNHMRIYFFVLCALFQKFVSFY